MKKSIVFGLFSLLLVNVFAVKKDPNAWKAEVKLESQFTAFKKSASYWDGYFMYKEAQLNEFHKVLMDSVSELKVSIIANDSEIKKLQSDITVLAKAAVESQVKLDESFEKEGSLVTLGIQFDKTAFPALMYTITVILTLITLVAIFLFFRSNIVSRETKKVYDELYEEFDRQKKRGLERETKLNRELQTERNKNSSI